jgi:hypothetical protein
MTDIKLTGPQIRVLRIAVSRRINYDIEHLQAYYINVTEFLPARFLIDKGLVDQYSTYSIIANAAGVAWVAAHPEDKP